MTEIVPYLPKQFHGPSPRVPIAEIVNAVLYKLKSGVQWHMLPVSELFGGEPLHYKTVFGHYRKWRKAGRCMEKMPGKAAVGQQVEDRSFQRRS